MVTGNLQKKCCIAFLQSIPIIYSRAVIPTSGAKSKKFFYLEAVFYHRILASLRTESGLLKNICIT